MSRPAMPLVLSIAAVALGGAALFVALDLRRTTSASTEAADATRDALDVSVAELRAGLDGAQRDVQGLKSRLRSLEGSVSDLRERSAPSAGGAGAATPPPEEAAAADPIAPAPPEDPAARLASRVRLVRAQSRRVIGGGASREDSEAMWAAARERGVVEALLAELESAVAARPSDAAAHMELADAYVVRLLTIPGGPEQGKWNDLAERQWTKVAELDPDHWDARFALAENWAQYPPFLNKAGDALRAFEALRELQERRPPEPKHARTYLHLSMLHARQGDEEKAREALEAGLRRHPDDAALERAAKEEEDR